MTVQYSKEYFRAGSRPKCAGGGGGGGLKLGEGSRGLL